MRKVDLNFHKAGSRGKRAAGSVLLLMGMLVAVWMVILHNDAKVEQRRIQLILDQQRNANSRHSPTTDAQSQDTAQEYRRAASVIDQLSFPWNKLFKAIEENTSEDATLLSIQPNTESNTVVLDAEAKDWGGMVRYIKRLEGDGFFSDVHLISHQTQQSDPQRPVRFKLTCSWQSSLPDGPVPGTGR